jgi:GT2 family glycosyltransferase
MSAATVEGLVSIVIVTWNTRDLLRGCLRSIGAAGRGGGIEVIVVDNASTDGTAEMVAREFPDVRLVASATNDGFGRANNRGAAEARGEYILLLNPDTEVGPQSVARLRDVLQREPRVGMAGCALVGTDGRIQYTCARRLPTAFNQFCHLSGLSRLFRGSPWFATVEMDYWDHGDSRDVECLSGACMMIRRALFEELHGFDESLFMYAEDVDLCYRVGRLGWRIHYLADERILHYGGQSSGQRETSFFSAVLQRHSNNYFLRKSKGPVAAAGFRVAVLMGSLLRMLAIVLASPFLFLARRSFPGAALRKYAALSGWAVAPQRAVARIMQA